MAEGLLSLSIQLCCNVTQSSTCSDHSGVSNWIGSDAVEATHVNDQVAILSSETKGGIAVSSTLSRDSKSCRNTAGYGVLDMLDSRWHSVRGRRDRHTKVERLYGLSVVAGVLGENGHIVRGKAVVNSGTLIKGVGKCRSRKKRSQGHEPSRTSFHAGEGLG